jgi:hypothetical protein
MRACRKAGDVSTFPANSMEQWKFSIIGSSSFLFILFITLTY